MDQGLEIAEVATLFGVTPDTIINWEQGRCAPTYSCGKKIMDFLGYCPFEDPETLGDHMRLWRWKRGLNSKEAAEAIGVDPSTWRSWERGGNKPVRASWERLLRHGIVQRPTSINPDDTHPAGI